MGYLGWNGKYGGSTEKDWLDRYALKREMIRHRGTNIVAVHRGDRAGRVAMQAVISSTLAFRWY